MREEVAEGWRRPHNEEVQNLYALPNITVTKSRRMGWTGHIARMGDMHTRFWSENLKGTNNLEELGEDGRIILQ
jgi:hypothetical protein